MSKRPSRKYPSYTKIFEYHGYHKDDSKCMACDEGYDKWSQLERAHIIARHKDGLDNEANLWLLCSKCHRGAPMTGWGPQPDFGPGDEIATKNWRLNHPKWTDGFKSLMDQVARVLENNPDLASGNFDPNNPGLVAKVAEAAGWPAPRESNEH